MYKTIAIVRVSSSKQKTESQKKELIEYIVRDGKYQIEDIQVIEHTQSGSKPSEEESRIIQDMYAAIENPENHIESVYCWELSRLSRQPETIHRVVKYLTDRKIDLRIMDLNLKLLDSNKKPVDGTKIIISIFATLCENEIRAKNERTLRGKEQHALHGGFNGGRFIRFGYRVNPETKIYEIDASPEGTGTADMVQTIYEMYATGKYGLTRLYDALPAHIQEKVSLSSLKVILSSAEYTGRILFEKTSDSESSDSPGRFQRQFPAIISEQLFTRCREVAAKNNVSVDKSLQTIYYAAKLIRCTTCGFTLTPMKYNLIYRCSHRHNRRSKVQCNGTDNININIIDGLLWQIVRDLEIDSIRKDNREQLNRYTNRIAELQEKINSSDRRYQLIWETERKKIKKSLNAIPDDMIDDITNKQTKADKERIRKETAEHREEIKRLESLIDMENLKHNRVNRNWQEITEEFHQESKKIHIAVSGYTDRERYDAIHRHVKKITVAESSVKFVKEIIIHFFDQSSQTWYYRSKSPDENRRVFRFSEMSQYATTPQEREASLIYITFPQRFESKRRKKLKIEN
jgi:DNA invertase Pin-like site-specific DNA recombinase